MCAKCPWDVPGLRAMSENELCQALLWYIQNKRVAVWILYRILQFALWYALDLRWDLSREQTESNGSKQRNYSLCRGVCVIPRWSKKWRKLPRCAVVLVGELQQMRIIENCISGLTNLWLCHCVTLSQNWSHEFDPWMWHRQETNLILKFVVASLGCTLGTTVHPTSSLNASD